ncbi:heavy-metal-associated domain-containing protein [Rhodoferax sp. AJA081-3]|jgi:copper chaperone|uniref:heavy-metal-associated domain-containing protein n=1 Tax=Rhodoferax sp. AJA081-3 TaxID=2752316 RepID=UPI001ADFC22C|nr:heavy-metal-associated domain-containing protein [Rhodoferax sp. AJA081-3]QTN28901.1 heavy-metal-associated domain-containing protein [Rhodoferax sp. AJA081-3]
MIEFQIPDMTCGHCASMVSSTLALADPDCKVTIDLAQHKVSVQTTEEKSALVEALTEAGYPPA